MKNFNLNARAETIKLKITRFKIDISSFYNFFRFLAQKLLWQPTISVSQRNEYVGLQTDLSMYINAKPSKLWTSDSIPLISNRHQVYVLLLRLFSQQQGLVVSLLHSTLYFLERTPLCLWCSTSASLVWNRGLVETSRKAAYPCTSPHESFFRRPR